MYLNGEAEDEQLLRLMERVKQPEDPGFLARMKNAYGELTAPRAPLNDPELYLDQSQVPREGYGATALGNLVRAAMAAAPDTSVKIGGENGVAIDPTGMMGIGEVGKFKAATKRGNVVHAANEFQPLLKEQRALREANRAALSDEFVAKAPALIHQKMEFEFPEVDLKQFKNYRDLNDLQSRIRADWRNAYPRGGGDIPSWEKINSGGLDDEQVSLILKRMNEAEADSGYLWPSADLESRLSKTYHDVVEKKQKVMARDELRSEVGKEKRALERLKKEPRGPWKTEHRAENLVYSPEDDTIEAIQLEADLGSKLAKRLAREARQRDKDFSKGKK